MAVVGEVIQALGPWPKIRQQYPEAMVEALLPHLRSFYESWTEDERLEPYAAFNSRV